MESPTKQLFSAGKRVPGFESNKPIRGSVTISGIEGESQPKASEQSRNRQPIPRHVSLVHSHVSGHGCVAAALA